MKVLRYSHKDRIQFNVTLNLYTDLKEDELEKVEKAVHHMAKALSSQEFYDHITGYNYKVQVCSGRWWWKKCYSQIRYGLRRTNGLSHDALYNTIVKGAEKLDPVEDNEADIHLEIDFRNSKNVIGYTYPSSIKQWLYYKFFSKYDYTEIAGNMAHEWCHKLGFQHSRKYHSTRKHTVPYVVGYFVRDFKQES